MKRARAAAPLLYLMALAALPCSLPAASLQETLTADSVVSPIAAPALHFLGGVASGVAVGALLMGGDDPSLFSQYPFFAPAAALAVAVTAGMGKELLDSTGFGDAGFADIVTTALGGLTAAAVIGYAESAPRSSATVALFLGGAALLLSLPVAAGMINEIKHHLERKNR